MHSRFGYKAVTVAQEVNGKGCTRLVPLPEVAIVHFDRSLGDKKGRGPYRSHQDVRLVLGERIDSFSKGLWSCVSGVLIRQGPADTISEDSSLPCRAPLPKGCLFTGKRGMLGRGTGV